MNNRILFKLENLQKSGSFKYRGAINTILYNLEQGRKIDNVFAYSSGNHGIALSEICKSMNIRCHIFVYNKASQYKLDIMKANGAIIHSYPDRREAENECYKYANAIENSIVIPPSDLDETIYGHGTILYEIVNEDGYKPDYVFVPCGGGGLCAGSLLNINYEDNHSKNMKIIAIEPKKADKALKSFQLGRRYFFDNVVDTIADGARPLNLSEKSYEIMKKYYKNLELYSVSDDDLIQWTIWLEKLNLILEPTSTLAFAGMYNYLRSNLNIINKEIVIIVTGRNYDSQQFYDTYHRLENVENVII